MLGLGPLMSPMAPTEVSWLIVGIVLGAAALGAVLIGVIAAMWARWSAPPRGEVPEVERPLRDVA